MEEMLQTLPRKNHSLMSCMYNYQGFWYHPTALQGIISAQRNFKADPTDIFLCSAPKTGTTWLKALAFAIATRKKFDNSNSPLLTCVSHDCIPSLEIDLDKIQHRKTSQLPLIATHDTSYSSLPETIKSSNCKIVYIYRDAKDVIVSFYQFMRRGFLKTPEDDVAFLKAYQEFCEGFSFCGPYWDHISGYLKSRMERPDQILILKYEDIKSDASGNVKKLAEFIGHPFSTKEEKEGVVEHIVKLCSFQNMSNLEVNKTGTYRADRLAVENKVFFRKGEVGDWKNYFTVEMEEEVEKLMKQKLPF